MVEVILAKAKTEAGMVTEWIKIADGVYEGQCIGCEEFVNVSFKNEGVTASNKRCKKEPGFCLLTQLGVEARTGGYKFIEV